MAEKVKIWTKQHKNILQDLEQSGRYLVKKEYIINKMEEHSGIYLDTYNWLFHSASRFMEIPEDARYPIWVSVTEESRIQNSEGNVLLEILVDADKIFVMDLDKWGRIVNYMYIPKDPQDEREHEELLKRYGIDDSTAYMSPFYPSVKSKIIKSWDRLYDEGIELSPAKVGIIWEVKQEWIVKIDT